jgi:exopolysaccharide biosynthesis polyprenyl glycosylphosphotransferase
MTSRGHAQRILGWPSVDRVEQAQRRTIASNFGRRDFVVRRLLAVADVTSFLLGLFVMVLVSHRARYSPHLLWGIALIPVWIGMLAAYGLYNRDIKRISHSTLDDVPWILHAVLVLCLLTWLYYHALPISKLGGNRVDVLTRKMVARPDYGLEPVAVVDEDFDLEEALILYQPERIVLGDTSLEEAELVQLVHRCKEHSLKVSLLPQLFSALGPSVEIDDVEGVTVLGINPPVLPRSSRYMKRVLDIGLSTVLLLLLAPALAVIALAIKLESRGPVFFMQRRVGREGEPFRLIKFRTMVVGAEGQTESLFRESEDSNWLKLDHDPRITRVGRFLRLASLDELPQFWNILRGDMSLVGPRPLIESEDRQIAGWGRSRLELTPGLTGLWQVLGRTNIPFEEMVKLDYMYVTNWSLWSDIRLILRTLPAVVTRRGAN